MKKVKHQKFVDFHSLSQTYKDTQHKQRGQVSHLSKLKATTLCCINIAMVNVAFLLRICLPSGAPEKPVRVAPFHSRLHKRTAIRSLAICCLLNILRMHSDKHLKRGSWKAQPQVPAVECQKISFINLMQYGKFESYGNLV